MNFSGREEVSKNRQIWINLNWQSQKNGQKCKDQRSKGKIPETRLTLKQTYFYLAMGLS